MSLEIRTVVAEGPFESAVSFRRVPWMQTRRMRFTSVFSEVMGRSPGSGPREGQRASKEVWRYGSRQLLEAVHT